VRAGLRRLVRDGEQLVLRGGHRLRSTMPAP
jgi:hypothetical protein